MRDHMTIRIAASGDAAVTRLARLDSADPPAGRTLVAEVGGRAVAAVALDERAVVADPFERTADIVAIVQERAAELRGERVAAGLRRWRRGERSIRRRPAAGVAPLLRPRAAIDARR